MRRAGEARRHRQGTRVAREQREGRGRRRSPAICATATFPPSHLLLATSPPLATSQSGQLSIDEVEQLFETAKLKATFDELDTDHSGTIAADELSDALKKLGYNVPDKQCKELLEKVRCTTTTQRVGRSRSSTITTTTSIATTTITTTTTATATPAAAGAGRPK